MDSVDSPSDDGRPLPPALPYPGPSTSALGEPPPPIKTRRGRKQNDDLPPSRSRDVQRAFRARRAERLAWLEARVTELEAENVDLRSRLGIRGDRDPGAAHSSPNLPLAAPGRNMSPVQRVPPLPLPLPALPRSSNSAPNWMGPPASMYMTQHMHPNSAPVPPMGDNSAQDATALAEFVNGLTGGAAYTSDDRNGGPVPPDFVPARVAWNSIGLLSSAARGADPSAPSPAQLGSVIRGLVARPGQPPGAFVRQDGDRVLVSIAALEHIIAKARPPAQQQPPLQHPPHLPNYSYTHLQAPPESLHAPMPMHQRHGHAPNMFGELENYEGE